MNSLDLIQLKIATKKNRKNFCYFQTIFHFGHLFFSRLWPLFFCSLRWFNFVFLFIFGAFIAFIVCFSSYGAENIPWNMYLTSHIHSFCISTRFY